jgi:hypothetical protein
MGVLGRFTDGVRERRGPALEAQESVALTGAPVPTGRSVRVFLGVKPGTVYSLAHYSHKSDAPEAFNRNALDFIRRHECNKVCGDV